MISERKIPSLAIPRLSIYYRALLESRETDIISSEQIAELTGYTAAQIRRDLAYFGQFGIPGKGYNVGELKKRILEILGIDKEWKVALVGVGNLGAALLAYEGFKKQRFEIVAAFDNDIRKIGRRWENIEIQDIRELPEIIKRENIIMAIVTVPGDIAQEVVNFIVTSGIRVILNFAPTRVRVPENVKLLNIDMAIELERLSYMASREQI